MSTYGLWLSAAGMQVNEHRQAVLANNMANANTTGFKLDLAMVTQRRVESQASEGGFGFEHPVLDGLAGGLNVRPTYTNFAQGSIEWTGKPLDVAIDGEGFFVVSDGSQTRYSRDGEFVMNATGEMVLAAGDGQWRVLDEAGSPIRLDPNGPAVNVTSDGRIRQGDTVVAKLGLADTDDKQSLRKVGGNLFDAGKTEMVPIQGHLEPKSRESSNFDVIKGLATMIEASRAYQLNAKLVQLQDRMTDQAVTTVGRLVA